MGLLLGLCASGCFFGADGREPPADELVFPTGVVVSPGGTTLYVSNSDFDLKYSGGSLMALDLHALRQATEPIAVALAMGTDRSVACGAAGLTINPDGWLVPVPCAPFLVAPFVANVAFIGAFASGLLLTHDPVGNRARLFAPVRGDPSITYFDVSDDRGADSATATDFRLDCDQLSTGACGASHRLGQDPDRNLRGVQLPADPVGIAATGTGEAIVVAHQTQGAASLLINPWDGAPELAYFVSGLPQGPTELATIPEPAFVAVAEAAAAPGQPFIYRRGFTLTFRASSEVDLLRYVPDSGAVPPRPFIQREIVEPIVTNASAVDSRGIAIFDARRRACEAGCAGQDAPLECLVSCAENVPLRVFVANRNPASLLIGEMTTNINRTKDATGQERLTSATERVTFYDSVPLNFGPSRVEVGQVINADGQPEPRIFAVAFDTRSVFIVDPVRTRVESVIRAGRGPQDVAFHTGVDGDGNAFSYLYVAHFTDSYLGVVDLDLRRPTTYGQMFATIGLPKDPEESN